MLYLFYTIIVEVKMHMILLGCLIYDQCTSFHEAEQSLLQNVLNMFMSFSVNVFEQFSKIIISIVYWFFAKYGQTTWTKNATICDCNEENCAFCNMYRYLDIKNVCKYIISKITWISIWITQLIVKLKTDKTLYFW